MLQNTAKCSHDADGKPGAADDIGPDRSPALRRPSFARPAAGRAHRAADTGSRGGALFGRAVYGAGDKRNAHPVGTHPASSFCAFPGFSNIIYFFIAQNRFGRSLSLAGGKGRPDRTRYRRTSF